MGWGGCCPTPPSTPACSDHRGAAAAGGAGATRRGAAPPRRRPAGGDGRRKRLSGADHQGGRGRGWRGGVQRGAGRGCAAARPTDRRPGTSQMAACAHPLALPACRPARPQVQRRISLLEDRLQQASVRYNEQLTRNRQLRGRIDGLRRERRLFEELGGKLGRGLARRQAEMADLIARIAESHEAREKVRRVVCSAAWRGVQWWWWCLWCTLPPPLPPPAHTLRRTRGLNSPPCPSFALPPPRRPRSFSPRCGRRPSATRPPTRPSGASSATSSRRIAGGARRSAAARSPPGSSRWRRCSSKTLLRRRRCRRLHPPPRPAAAASSATLHRGLCPPVPRGLALPRPPPLLLLLSPSRRPRWRRRLLTRRRSGCRS